MKKQEASENTIRLLLRYFSVIILVCGLMPSPLRAQELIGAGVDYANPRPYKIGGITVVGSQQSDVQAIKLIAGLREGDEVLVPGDDFSKAIKNLWNQRLFTEVSINVAQIRGDEIFLVIYLKEMPRLSRYMFDGIRKSEGDNLREKIDIRHGIIVTENLKSTSISQIRDYYIEKGFFNVSVKDSVRPDPADTNFVFLRFIVDKGERTKVSSISFEGVSALSEKKLRRAMKNTKEKAWWRVFKSSKIMDAEYEEDKESLIAKYNKEGFRNAIIVSDTLMRDGSDRVAVRIKVDEGNKFYFRNMSFLGNTKYRSTQLDSLINIRNGDVYNSELLEMRLFGDPNGRDLSSLYMDDGYLGFRAFPVETVLPGDSIDIEIRIYEGGEYHVGNVSVVGNTKTNDHVIFREIRTRPGDKFSRADVIRTQRELAALQYFNLEKFDVRTTPRADENVVDLEYVVEEKPSDQIELSGGWGGNRVVGSLGLSFNNFSMRNIFKRSAWSPLPTGDGQRLSIRAVTNGVFFQSYNLSFTEPWLGGRKANSFGVSVYSSTQSNGQRKKIDGEINPLRQSLNIIGASVNFGKRLQRPDDWFLINGGITYQHFDLNNFGSFFSFSNGFSNNLSANFTIERNSIFEPIYPTYGSRVSLMSKFTFPYTLWGSEVQNKTYDYDNMSDQERFDWVEYYKIKFVAEWYTPLNRNKERKFVLTNKIGVGFLGTYNNRLGESPFERFYLGGVFLSGFLLDGREIVNLRGYDDLSLTFPSDNVGSPVIAKYSTEIRYPLSTNPSATIFALAFAEAGNTWSEFRDFSPFNLYRSGGMGLRIFLPMFGMLGFDYGWRFDDVPSNPSMAKGQFHFSIGMNLGEL
ncbi:MAG: outer membrane protein assembly factor BamA [Bacteroidota bacterium]